MKKAEPGKIRSSARRTTVEGPKLAADLAKQLITLSTALASFTIALANVFVDESRRAGGPPASLKIAWLLYLLAIAAACWTLLAVGGTLFAFDRSRKDLNPRDTNIAIPAAIMAILFLAAIGLTIHASIVLLP